VSGDAAVAEPKVAGACYVYGIVPADAEPPRGAEGVGDPAGEVSTVRHGAVAGIITDLQPEAELGTRRDLLRHSRLLDRIAVSTPVLPVRFGSVLSAPAPGAVVDELLAPHHDELETALSALRDRAQFTVKARYVEDAVLREVVAEEPEIARLRETVNALPPDAAYYERIRLGELIVHAVERRREGDAAALFDQLSPYAAAAVWRPASTEEGIADAALLVDHDRWPALERAVEGVARRGAGRIVMRMLGPIAPYDFTNDVLEEE
jgi:gas vesicle protein GvpL/GvpF